MSELQQVIAMLTRLGVFKHYPHLTYLSSDVVTRETTLQLEAGDRNRGPLIGYAGFCTDWTFNEQGQLLTVGVWE